MLLFIINNLYIHKYKICDICIMIQSRTFTITLLQKLVVDILSFLCKYQNEIQCRLLKNVLGNECRTWALTETKKRYGHGRAL